MINKAEPRTRPTRLSLDECLGVVAKQFETSAGQRDDLAFAVFIILVVRFNIALGDLGNHVDDFI